METIGNKYITDHPKRKRPLPFEEAQRRAGWKILKQTLRVQGLGPLGM